VRQELAVLPGGLKDSRARQAQDLRESSSPPQHHYLTVAMHLTSLRGQA
jgi:hypothetical protein